MENIFFWEQKIKVIFVLFMDHIQNLSGNVSNPMEAETWTNFIGTLNDFATKSIGQSEIVWKDFIDESNRILNHVDQMNLVTMNMSSEMILKRYTVLVSSILQNKINACNRMIQHIYIFEPIIGKILQQKSHQGMYS